MPSLHETKQSVTILIVDDHPTFREGLKSVIGHISGLTVCAETADERSAMHQLEDVVPTMMIVDINLKSSSGLTLIRRARKINPALRILVASMYEESVYGERAFKAGADGYICKQDAPEKLMQAIRTVSRGGCFFSDALEAQMRVQTVSPSGESDEVGDPVATLSERELEIFTLIGSGQSTREIADRLYLSAKTVSTHRDHIKKKIGLKDNVRLVHRAVEWVLLKET